jgi:hypothetical protein
VTEHQDIDVLLQDVLASETEQSDRPPEDQEEEPETPSETIARRLRLVSDPGRRVNAADMRTRRALVHGDYGRDLAHPSVGPRIQSSATALRVARVDAMPFLVTSTRSAMIVSAPSPNRSSKLWTAVGPNSQVSVTSVPPSTGAKA